MEVGHDFDRLFREEADGVYRTLFAFTGGRAEVAEEATAEAFARALARRGELRDPVAWIYRAAFRIAIDELRRERRIGQAKEESAVDPPEFTDLMGALRRLPPRQRAALVLHYQAGLPVVEVARRLGTASATVRVHLHRGRNRLRELLGTGEGEQP